MLVTVATEDGKSSQMEIPAETPVATVVSLVASELRIAGGRLVLVCNGQPLASSVTLGGAGVKDQDLLLIMGEGSASATAAAPGKPNLEDLTTLEPHAVLEFFKQNPQLLKQLHHVDPGLAQAVETGDVVKVRTCVMVKQMSSHKAKWTKHKERVALFANPDSEESQAKIARMIQQEAIDQNLTMAMEEAPEVFVPVMMLYIDTEINGERVKAFVDSGAQMTIMSAACAERCGLMRLVDRRFDGEVRGVGTGNIIGIIHMAQIKIGPHHFPCSFTILEKCHLDFLFGLDMLKRHLCVIDLKNGVLALGSAGTTVPFLSEKDLPSSAKETKADDRERKLSAEASSASSPASASAAPSGPAPAPAPAPAPTSAGSSGGGSAAVLSDEAKVLQLVGMGFSRQAAESVLASTGGDVEQAAGLLFAQMER